MKRPVFISYACVGIIALLSHSTVRAQPASMLEIMPRMNQAGNAKRPSLIQAQFESSVTELGNAQFLGEKRGDSNAMNTRMNLFAPLPLNEKWIVPLGMGTENLFLDSVDDIPLPDNIHTATFNTGLGHRPNMDWMMMGTLGATLYKFSDLEWNDIGVSGGINVMWRYSYSVTWRFGLLASPDSDIPVLPMVGVDWQINDHTNLRFLFPQPRLTYQLDERWRFYTGLNLIGSTFRTSETLGSSIGISQYNDALGTYRDIRVGGGVSYQLRQRFSIETEVGYSVYRRIDYTRIEESIDFDPAPYLRIGLRLGF